MRVYKCKCGGVMKPIAVVKSLEPLYKDLYICTNCNKRFIYKQGHVREISMEEWKNLLVGRKKLL